MYTHALRRPVRERTVADLRAAGVTVDALCEQTEAPTQIGNRLNAARALREAFLMSSMREGILLLEDDLEVGSALPRWCAYLEGLHLTGPVTLCAFRDRFLPAEAHREWARGRAKRPRLVPVADPVRSRWWGAQALYLPARVAALLLAYPDLTVRARGPGPFDHAVRAWLKQSLAPLYATVPSVVQHRAERNLVNPKKAPARAQLVDLEAAPPQAHPVEV